QGASRHCRGDVRGDGDASVARAGRGHADVSELQLALLGGFHARLTSGAALALPTKKAQALLTYLALPVGRAHPRGKLAALLWGGIREEAARGSLRHAAFSSRKALGEATRGPARQPQGAGRKGRRAQSGGRGACARPAQRGGGRRPVRARGEG